MSPFILDIKTARCCVSIDLRLMVPESPELVNHKIQRYVEYKIDKGCNEL